MTKTDEIAQLKRATERLRSWWTDDALPLWQQAAFDPEGGYFEDLDLKGKPRPQENRRVRVQPRQAYVFAHAGRLGWCKNAQTLSTHGFDYLLDQGTGKASFDTQQFSGFAHRLYPDGRVLDPAPDTYDHAFVLLACAWRIKAFNDTRSQSVAKAVLTFLDTALGEADGSFREGVPASLPRRQNPHMHLFEAFLALYDATGDEQYGQRAKKLFDLFNTHFWDGTHRVVREFFTADWQVDPRKGDLVEPGHMMEWCGLLDQYNRLFKEDIEETTTHLFESAENIGRDDTSVFLVDQVHLSDSRGGKTTRRTWVQTEYIKACLVRARRGHEGMAAQAEDLIHRFMETYLTTDVSGGYIDQFDASGVAISHTMPTSTLYHLMSLVAEAVATAEQL